MSTSPGGYWIDDCDPFAIHLGAFGIRWYGLAYLAGLFCGFLLVRRWLRQGRIPLPAPLLQDFVLSIGLGMIIGGRLGYCLLYEPMRTFLDPLWVLRIWEGGMASHGGIIGLMVGAWIFTRRWRVSWWVMMDVVAAAGPIGIGFGRIANFINGELWGRVTQVPWAVIFPRSVVPPYGLSEAATRAYQIQHALPRHPSQLYAAVMEGFAIALILIPIQARHRKPGVTSALFLVLYGCGRFIDECFRQPDVGQPIFFGWMSKGQAYTLPMLVVGVILLAYRLSLPPRPECYRIPVHLAGADGASGGSAGAAAPMPEPLARADADQAGSAGRPS